MYFASPFSPSDVFPNVFSDFFMSFAYYIPGEWVLIVYNQESEKLREDEMNENVIRAISLSENARPYVFYRNDPRGGSTRNIQQAWTYLIINTRC